MDATPSLKMSTAAIQNYFSYVEEENLLAIVTHLEKFKEVDSRSDVGASLGLLVDENFDEL